MNERIPDFFERGEDRCERWAAEHLRGDIATCECGREFKLSEGQTMSPDPYAIPICPTCFEEALDRIRRETEAALEAARKRAKEGA